MKNNWKDIFAEFDGETLTLGNSRFCRRFDLSKGMLRTISLTDGKGRLFASENTNCTDFECYGAKAPLSSLESKLISVDFAIVEDDPFDAPHALVTVNFSEGCSLARTVREFFLYPELPAYAIRNRIESTVIPRFDFISRQTLAKDFADFFEGERGRGNAIGELRRQEPLMDTFHPAEGFQVTRSVEFFAHTDLHDHPVVEHPAEGQKELVGNLLYCEAADGAGLMMLQEAPVSSERLERENYDFRLASNGDVYSLCWGILPEEVPCGKEMLSYRNMIGLYENEWERESLLKQYMRMRMDCAKPRRSIVVNAWGCGNFQERLNPEFMRDEIRAAAECGGETYQVDDGWEMGRSLGEIVNRNVNRSIKEFWAINPEKVGAEGFEGLCKTAKDAGINLALWVAPNASVMYRDHDEFSKMLLDFHSKYGFSCFKVDAAMLMSYETRKNFETLLRHTRQASDMEIYFNLDVTANMRCGYFMFMEYGLLFLENRYANLPWGLGYHPERTLRNFWHLSKYVRAQHLQIEVLPHDIIKASAYEQRKEQDPRIYPQEYWAAIALFANPLYWFAPSTVSPENRRHLKKMADLYIKYRPLIFGGEIYPIGDEPNGKALTGFVSRNDDGTPRIAIVLRESACEQSTLELPGASWQCVAGDGTAKGSSLTVNAKASWALFTAN